MLSHFPSCGLVDYLLRNDAWRGYIFAAWKHTVDELIAVHLNTSEMLHNQRVRWVI